MIASESKVRQVEVPKGALVLFAPTRQTFTAVTQLTVRCGDAAPALPLERMRRRGEGEKAPSAGH